MRITMGEGHTPLVPSVRIGPKAGSSRLLFKLESCNPSGSYKDRFIAAEVAELVRQGHTSCLATSSGNTGSSLAACCARYGLKCIILVNESVPEGKLAQMQAHGAQVIRIPQFVTDPAVTGQVFDQLQDFSRRRATPLVVSAYRYCPAGMAGVESLAGEVESGTQGQVDHVFVPVGGGGLYSAVVRGFEKGGRLPKVHAVQPSGCSTVVASFERNDPVIRSVTSSTRISGLSVPYDIDASLALGLLGESGGRGFAVSDEQVFDAQRRMLEEEGIYCEPAGAAALAGWLRACEEGTIEPHQMSVCLVTGHGFKDTASIAEAARRHPELISLAGNLPGLLESLLARGHR